MSDDCIKCKKKLNFSDRQGNFCFDCFNVIDKITDMFYEDERINKIRDNYYYIDSLSDDLENNIYDGLYDNLNDDEIRERVTKFIDDFWYDNELCNNCKKYMLLPIKCFECNLTYCTICIKNKKCSNENCKKITEEEIQKLKNFFKDILKKNKKFYMQEQTLNYITQDMYSGKLNKLNDDELQNYITQKIKESMYSCINTINIFRIMSGII